MVEAAVGAHETDADDGRPVVLEQPLLGAVQRTRRQPRVGITPHGAIGSTLGAIALGWTFDALPRGRRAMLVTAPLLPLWSLLCLAVNLAGAGLDRLDRTGMYYGNLLVLARRPA